MPIPADQRERLYFNGIILTMREVIVMLMIDLRRAGALDDEAISTLRERALAAAKSLETEGMPIEEEAGPFREAIEDFEKHFDIAVSKLRKLDGV